MARTPAPKPPVKFCGEKGCGKKMAAFQRGRSWKYVCPDAGKHAADKLKAKQRGPEQGKGGVKRGTPSPKHGKKYPKPVRKKWRWGSEKDKDPGKGK